jgi:hypothetical protein
LKTEKHESEKDRQKQLIKHHPDADKERGEQTDEWREETRDGYGRKKERRKESADDDADETERNESGKRDFD